MSNIANDQARDHWTCQILAFFYYRKWLGLSLVATIMLLSIWGILYLEVETDMRKFLPQNTAERQATQKIKELYDIDSEIVIVYEAPDISDPKVMNLVQQITDELQSLAQTPEIELSLAEAATLNELSLDEAPLSDLAFFNDAPLMEGPTSKTSLIQEVLALNTVSIIGIDTEGQLEQTEVRSLEGAALKQQLQDWELYDKALYSDDFRYGAIIIQPRLDLSSGVNHKLYRQIVHILQSFEGRGLRFFLSGEAAIYSVMNDYITGDLIRLIPLLGLIVCVIFYSYFRRASALLIILFPVVFALLATIGLMGWLGIEFTFIHASIPVIIMALGSADSIHTLTHFTKQKSVSMLQRIQATQSALLRPITLTSITTSIGFLSFANSVMLPIRSFGIFCTVGIALAWLSSVFISPLLLTLYSPQKKGKGHCRIHNRVSIGQWAWNFTRILLRHPYISRLLLLVGCAGLLLSISRVSVNNDTIGYFHSNTPVVEATQILGKEMGGVSSIHISIQAEKRGGAVTEPEVLQYMAGLADYVRQQNPRLVNKTIGLQDFVLQINKLFNPGIDSGQDALPSSRQIIVQYLSLFGNINSFVSPDVYEARNARVSIHLSNGSKDSVQKVLSDIEQYQSQHQIAGYSQLQGGYALMINRMNQLVVRQQIRSIIFAIIGVFLIVLFSFRSLRLGLLACLPPVVTLLINLALMAWLRIDLNICTVLINSLVIGVGIDYSIHLISAYRQNQAAMPVVLKQVSASILLNAVAVGLGYATLVFSQFRSLGYFGGLSALANIIAAVLTLLVLPMLLLRKKDRLEL